MPGPNRGPGSSGKKSSTSPKNTTDIKKNIPSRNVTDINKNIPSPNVSNFNKNISGPNSYTTGQAAFKGKSGFGYSAPRPSQNAGTMGISSPGGKPTRISSSNVTNINKNIPAKKTGVMGGQGVSAYGQGAVPGSRVSAYARATQVAPSPTRTAGLSPMAGQGAPGFGPNTNLVNKNGVAYSGPALNKTYSQFAVNNFNAGRVAASPTGAPPAQGGNGFSVAARPTPAAPMSPQPGSSPFYSGSAFRPNPNTGNAFADLAANKANEIADKYAGRLATAGFYGGQLFSGIGLGGLGGGGFGHAGENAMGYAGSQGNATQPPQAPGLPVTTPQTQATNTPPVSPVIGLNPATQRRLMYPGYYSSWAGLPTGYYNG